MTASISDSGAGPDPGLLIGSAALGALMPMYVAVDDEGQIMACGPVLQRLLGGGADRSLAGESVFSFFEIRRPHRVRDMAGLIAHRGRRIYLTARALPRSQLRGVIVPLGDGRGWLLNLSFGLYVIDAVRDFSLTAEDFAVTDLAVELLYVVEAKSLIMEELRDLNLRLQGAKTRAEEQALTDTLTGLRNRRALDLTLERMVGEGKPFGLMHVDLDYFKAVNDTFGHGAGDHVLRAVAQVLLAETRNRDIITRFGGDEFVLLLPDLSDAPAMEVIAHRIISRLSEPISYEDQKCRVSASLGYTVSSRYAAPDAETMLEDADRALYAAKRDGRAGVRGFDDQLADER